jgi:hypothetical protein
MTNLFLLLVVHPPVGESQGPHGRYGVHIVPELLILYTLSLNQCLLHCIQCP